MRKKEKGQFLYLDETFYSICRSNCGSHGWLTLKQRTNIKSASRVGKHREMTGNAILEFPELKCNLEPEGEALAIWTSAAIVFFFFFKHVSVFLHVKWSLLTITLCQTLI